MTRNGKRWTTTEVLNLQREHELLNLSVEEIALNHKRSVKSIQFKLQSEGFMQSEEVLDDEVYSDTDSSSDYEEDVVENVVENVDEDYVECNLDKLSDRVWNLETNVEEISAMVKNIFELVSSQKKSKKLAPLRKYL